MDNETEVDTANVFDEVAIEEATEDVETLKARLALVEEERDRERNAKNAILARAKAAEAKNKTVINEPSKRNEQILDLRLDGLSAEEAAFVVANGGKKALEDKNSLVSIALQARRDQRLSEQAASQTAQGSSQLSEIERKFTPEQLKNMSAKELEKILPHA